MARPRKKAEELVPDENAQEATVGAEEVVVEETGAGDPVSEATVEPVAEEIVDAEEFVVEETSATGEDEPVAEVSQKPEATPEVEPEAATEAEEPVVESEPEPEAEPEAVAEVEVAESEAAPEAEPEPAPEPPAEIPEPAAEVEPAEETEAVAEPEAHEPEAEEPAAPAAPTTTPQAPPKITKAERRARKAARRAKPKPPKPAGERKPIVRVPKPEHERGRRKERRGVVVSNAMDKTIVVRVDSVKPDRRYKKVVRHSTKFHAHDAENSANVGDVVRIVETRPLSKTKNWRLAEITEKAR